MTEKPDQPNAKRRALAPIATAAERRTMARRLRDAVSADTPSKLEACFNDYGPLSAAWRAATKPVKPSTPPTSKSWKSLAQTMATPKGRALAQWQQAVAWGVDLNEVGPGTRPLLHRAAVSGDQGFVQALLEAGADPNVRGRHGETPLATIKPSDVPKVGAVLLDHGARVEGAVLPGESPPALMLWLMASRSLGWSRPEPGALMAFLIERLTGPEHAEAWHESNDGLLSPWEWLEEDQQARALGLPSRWPGSNELHERLTRQWAVASLSEHTPHAPERSRSPRL